MGIEDQASRQGKDPSRLGDMIVCVHELEGRISNCHAKEVQYNYGFCRVEASQKYRRPIQSGNYLSRHRRGAANQDLAEATSVLYSSTTIEGRLIDIRRFYEGYQRRSEYPFLDANMFRRIMPFTHTTSQFIFDNLRGSCRYISIFELMSILILSAFATYTSKMRCI